MFDVDFQYPYNNVNVILEAAKGWCNAGMRPFSISDLGWLYTGPNLWGFKCGWW